MNAGLILHGVGTSGGIGIDLKTINENMNQYTSIGHSNTTLTIGTSKNPVPILLELAPLVEVVARKMWGPLWHKNKVDLKQKNIEKALKLYPSETGASIKAGKADLCSISIIILF